MKHLIIKCFYIFLNNIFTFFFAKFQLFYYSLLKFRNEKKNNSWLFEFISKNMKIQNFSIVNTYIYK